MIATAVSAMADDVEARASITTWDAHRQPTQEQKAAKVGRVKAVARDLLLLADHAETRSIRDAEFDVSKARLYVLGLNPPRILWTKS